MNVVISFFILIVGFPAFAINNNFFETSGGNVNLTLLTSTMSENLKKEVSHLNMASPKSPYAFFGNLISDDYKSYFINFRIDEVNEMSCQMFMIFKEDRSIVDCFSETLKIDYIGSIPNVFIGLPNTSNKE